MPALMLLRRYWRLVLEGAGAAVLVLMLLGARHATAREAVAKDQIARLTREKHALAMERAVATVQYVTDVQQVGVAQASYDSLARRYRQSRDSMGRLTAPSEPLDTTPVPRDSVRQIVASADASALACHRALRDCGTLLRIDSLTIANRDSTIVATRQLLPTRADRVRGAVKWAAIGYGVAKAVQLLTK